MKHYLGALTIMSALVFVACQKDEGTKEEPTTTTTGTQPLTPKEQARADFNTMYKASAVTDYTWNGNVVDCNPGALPQAVLDKAFLRLKYFRKAAGLPNTGIAMKADLNARCQYNALMIKANGSLSHSPPSTWKCYSNEGADAAANGNIAFGASDVENINLWIEDEGSNNMRVGHRRWMLFSRATDFGFGCTESSGTLWVINDLGFVQPPIPAKTPAFVAWPPKGFIPRDVVYPRWSLSIPAATYPYQVDFTSATVVMTDAQGNNVSLAIEYANPIENTYRGDNTITWRPAGINLSSDADQKYTVKVSNVMVEGVATNYQYDVTIFKP